MAEGGLASVKGVSGSTGEGGCAEGVEEGVKVSVVGTLGRLVLPPALQGPFPKSTLLPRDIIPRPSCRGECSSSFF